MRGIKFRAWNKIDHLMCDVVEILFGDDDNYVAVENGQYIERWRFDDIELMQYTGLDDINGNPIYEGDIVKAYRTCKSDLITFDNGSFGIALDDWHSFESFTDFYGKCEVIGNKFENPELLEATGK